MNTLLISGASPVHAGGGEMITSERIGLLWLRGCGRAFPLGSLEKRTKEG